MPQGMVFLFRFASWPSYSDRSMEFSRLKFITGKAADSNSDLTVENGSCNNGHSCGELEVAAIVDGECGDTLEPHIPRDDFHHPFVILPNSTNVVAEESLCSNVDVGILSSLDALQSICRDIIAPEPEIEGSSTAKHMIQEPSTGVIPVFNYKPLWGGTSVCGRRPEMEDAMVAVPHFLDIPIWMLNDHSVNGVMDPPSSIFLKGHFFGVYDGHGGSQVANYCRKRIHSALVEEIQNLKDGYHRSNDDCFRRWEQTFTNCFRKVDVEVAGSVNNIPNEGCSVCPLDSIAPETVGSTAVVAVICSSHIIVSNCGDSRAVLYRGKQPYPLSVDHKPEREDEYARIEAAGGKIIDWNGYRVSAVLSMSRSLGDKYLKPWIIPDPEVTCIARSKEDDCLILASDGLWDVMTNEEACVAARRRILHWHKKNGSSPSAGRGEVADPAAQSAADYLSNLALHKGSTDNITVIVVDLKAQRKLKSSA